MKFGGDHGAYRIGMPAFARAWFHEPVRARYSFIYVVLPESGGIAQLAEHELCKLGVTGSIPVASTY